MTDQDILKIATSHQKQMSSVHPRAIIGAIEDAIKEVLKISSDNMLANSYNRCNECSKKLERGTVFCSPDCRMHYHS